MSCRVNMKINPGVYPRALSRAVHKLRASRVGADLEGAGAEPTRGLQTLTTVPQTLQGHLGAYVPVELGCTPQMCSPAPSSRGFVEALLGWRGLNRWPLLIGSASSPSPLPEVGAGPEFQPLIRAGFSGDQPHPEALQRPSHLVSTVAGIQRFYELCARTQDKTR